MLPAARRTSRPTGKIDAFLGLLNKGRMSAVLAGLSALIVHFVS